MQDIKQFLINAGIRYVESELARKLTENEINTLYYTTGYLYGKWDLSVETRDNARHIIGGYKESFPKERPLSVDGVITFIHFMVEVREYLV